jgi:hypothetical protein
MAMNVAFASRHLVPCSMVSGDRWSRRHEFADNCIRKTDSDNALPHISISVKKLKRSNASDLHSKFHAETSPLLKPDNGSRQVPNGAFL